MVNVVNRHKDTLRFVEDFLGYLLLHISKNTGFCNVDYFESKISLLKIKQRGFYIFTYLPNQFGYLLLPSLDG